jgi:hypothetical protein
LLPLLCKQSGASKAQHQPERHNRLLSRFCRFPHDPFHLLVRNEISVYSGFSMLQKFRLLASASGEFCTTPFLFLRVVTENCSCGLGKKL